MSHFMTVAIMPKDIPIGEIETKLVDLMEPYNENTQVPPYPKECWCVGRKAKDEAHEATNERFGNLQMTREWFRRKHHEAHDKCSVLWRKQLDESLSEEEKDRAAQEEDAINETLEALWQEETNGREEFRVDYFENHPLRDHSDPECEECGGSGMVLSTYNPKSKWDWWVIGGRWDGVIQSERRESTDNGFNFGAKHHQLKYNTNTVENLITDKNVPFAVVTPEGEWIERGSMGWFAFVSGEKDKRNWNDEVLAIYEHYKDRIAVGIDCHI